jgi:hypothetical protein
MVLNSVTHSDLADQARLQPYPDMFTFSTWANAANQKFKGRHYSRLLAVSLARQCQLLPDDSAGLDTPAGLAGIGHIMH